MADSLPLKEKSIGDLFLGSEQTTYQIPIYQRNYAWSEDEIKTLVRDVYDALTKNDGLPYYIGTLVTYKRGDSSYEVIDGQQRLTTIYLMLIALKDLKLLAQETVFSSQLTYMARSNSAETLRKLSGPDGNRDTSVVMDQGIKRGYEYVLNAIAGIVEKKEKEKFTEYFRKNVRLIHYNVPKDVDLNHYFEVMNSRGEQLEKHEIVKARLYEILTLSSETTGSNNDGKKFTRVWDSCSRMNTYIQKAFETWEEGIDSFEKLPEQDLKEKKKIKELLMENKFAMEDSGAGRTADLFQPIIDFPNFLLIVLKLTLIKNGNGCPNVNLDDKELLNAFEDTLQTLTKEEDKKDFVRQFTLNLLWSRYLLDNYIVHHDLNDYEQANDNPWQLKKYFKNEKGEDVLMNVVANAEGEPKRKEQKELVHLLSMFEVSFSAKQRKNYLLYCLIHLFENIHFENKEKNHIVNTDEYLSFLQKLADKFFYGIYLNEDLLNERKQPVPKAFDDAVLKPHKTESGSVLDLAIPTDLPKFVYIEGECNIPLFVFNYLDYRIWKKYSERLQGKDFKEGSEKRVVFFNELGCSDFGLDVFDRFYFSRTRRSLEHFYPQSKASCETNEDGKPNTTQINCFGNFAMIGAEANSSGNNWDPMAKLTHYKDSKWNSVSVGSLKLQIMMQICRDKENWIYQDIKDHQEKMLAIISHPNSLRE